MLIKTRTFFFACCYENITLSLKIIANYWHYLNFSSGQINANGYSNNSC